MALFEILNAPGYSDTERNVEAAKLVGAHTVQAMQAALTRPAVSDQAPGPVYAARRVNIGAPHYTTTTTFPGLTSLNHRR